MFSDDISRILTEDAFSKRTFIGVYSADELNSLPKCRKKRYGLIVNTDPLNKPGRHWQSIFIEKDSCNFFCSLGEKPNSHILKFLSRFKQVYCNKNSQQKQNQVTCGGYCIFIQAMMARGYSFETLCNIFETINNDDEFVRVFLKDSYNF